MGGDARRGTKQEERMKTIASVLIAATLAVGGCASNPQRSDSASTSTTASTQPAPAAPAQNGDVREVKSKDGSYTGEIVGKPARGSKFGRLHIGMTMSEAQGVLGRAPDQWHTYESGKRWIPYYFGDDARRMQAFYKGEGCLTFTAGHVWGSGGGDLIRIENDATGACYQP
jgi:hypothetical protein